MRRSPLSVHSATCIAIASTTRIIRLQLAILSSFSSSYQSCNCCHRPPTSCSACSASLLFYQQLNLTSFLRSAPSPSSPSALSYRTCFCYCYDDRPINHLLLQAAVILVWWFHHEFIRRQLLFHAATSIDCGRAQARAGSRLFFCLSYVVTCPSPTATYS